MYYPSCRFESPANAQPALPCTTSAWKALYVASRLDVGRTDRQADPVCVQCGAAPDRETLH